MQQSNKESNMSLIQISKKLAVAGVRHEIVLANATPAVVTSLLADISDILDGYTECALWSSTYSGEDPDHADFEEGDDSSFRDLGYGNREISKTLNVSSTNDIKKLVAEIAKNPAAVAELEEYIDNHGASQFGHDFWLTRNGHGAGFNDRGGKIVHRLAKPFGEVNLFANKNGVIVGD
jgi:hypothetical protein